MFVREGWLWCVFSSLAGINSIFSFFGDALQSATQLFFNRIPQMTKYFVMRECDNIPTGISLCCDSAFAHKKEFLFLNSLKGSWRSLAEISQYFHFVDNSNHLKDLFTCILWTLVMSFSDAQAMILTVILTQLQ
jgi:hypothetical protein